MTRVIRGESPKDAIYAECKEVPGHKRRRSIEIFVTRLTNWLLEAHGFGPISGFVASALSWMANECIDGGIQIGARLNALLNQKPDRVHELNLENMRKVAADRVAALFRGLAPQNPGPTPA